MAIQNPLLYLDPGSGSLLFQLVLSALLTVAVFFRRVVQVIRAFFSTLRITRQRKDGE